MTGSERLTRRGTGALLALLCVIGFGLRVADIDWDAGQHLHPDERHWSFVTDDVAAPSGLRDYLDSNTSPFNPYATQGSWVYGTWPVAITKAAATWLAADGPIARDVTGGLDSVGVDLRSDGVPRFDAGYNANLIGRLISALFDTATIVVVFALARRLGGDRIAGLLASGLQTFTVLHLQYSHFYGAETLAAFTTTAVVLLSVKLARAGPRMGLLLATGALTGLAVAAKLSTAPVALAPIVGLLVATSTEEATHLERFRRLVDDLCLLGLSAVATVKFTLPYAFGQWWGLRFDQRYLNDLDYLASVNDGTFNVPWTIQWIGRSRLVGPFETAFWWGMGPALAVGCILGLITAVRRIRQGQRFWLVPVTFVAAEVMLVTRQFNGLIRYLLPAYPVAVAMAGVSLAALTAAARSTEVGIGRRRLAGVVVAACVAGTAFWGLAFTNGVYRGEHSRVQATEWMVDNIPAGSVVSHSVWDDALPLPDPAALELGFSIVDLDPFANDSPAKVESLIAGLDAVDYIVESSNRISDSITRFPARYPVTNRYYDLLATGELGFVEVARFSNPPSLFGIEIDDGAAEETFTVYDHPTVVIWQKTDDWSATAARRLLNPDRAANRFDTEHRNAGANAGQLRPDTYATQQRGGSFSEIFPADAPTATAPWLWWLVWIELAGIAAVPWTTWLFGRIGSRGYGFAKATGLLAVTVPLWFLVAIGAIHHTRMAAWVSLGLNVALGAAVGWRRRHTLASQWRLHHRSWLASEVLFLVVFGVLVLFAVANPDLWHPFVGGEKPMELAYFTAVTRSTTLPAYDPWFAGGAMNYYYLGWFVLSVPTKALGIVPEVAFNLGLPTMGAVGASTLFGTGQAIAGAVHKRGPRVSIVPGLAAAGAVLILSNLESAIQWFRTAPGRYDWWAPSRVNDSSLDITEFPFWSLLFRDLHPHVMDIAVLGLVVGTAVAYLVSERAGDLRRASALAVTLGALTGVVRMVHTWDLPAAALVTMGALVLGQIGRLEPFSRRMARLVGRAALVAGTHLVLTAPYTANIEVFDRGLEAAEEITGFGDFLSQFGLFVVIALGYAAVRATELGGRRLLGEATSAFLLVTTGITAFAAITVGATVALCVFATLGFIALAVAGRLDAGHAAVAGLFALGFATAGGVDVVTVVNDIDRLNTVFKFWYQSWQFLAVASGVAMWWLVTERADHLRRLSHRARAVTLGWTAVASALVVASLVYPVVAPPVRLGERFPGTVAPTGLDGMAYLETDPAVTVDGVMVDIGDDLPLIEWLRANVRGTPTIVETTGPLYSWTARMSVYTGLPTVLGWDWHQQQQRRDYANAVATRRADVETFYRSTDPDAISRFLRTYDVSYVIVGTLERRFGDPSALQALRSHPALVTVFEQGSAAIYLVDREALLQEYP